MKKEEYEMLREERNRLTYEISRSGGIRRSLVSKMEDRLREIRGLIKQAHRERNVIK